MDVAPDADAAQLGERPEEALAGSERREDEAALHVVEDDGRLHDAVRSASARTLLVILSTAVARLTCSPSVRSTSMIALVRMPWPLPGSS